MRESCAGNPWGKQPPAWRAAVCCVGEPDQYILGGRVRLRRRACFGVLQQLPPCACTFKATWVFIELTGTQLGQEAGLFDRTLERDRPAANGSFSLTRIFGMVSPLPVGACQVK